MNCEVKGCEKPARTRGWCSAHYERWRRNGDPGPPGDARRRPSKQCSIEGCDGVAAKRGWCEKHYQRWRAHGNPEHMERPTYGSGRRVRTDGYVDVWVPGHPLARADGYASEHRVVAWDAGALVNVEMQVHHRNGNKSDNRLENLEVVWVDEHIRDHHPASEGPPAENRAKTHCINGHPLVPENIYASQLPARICKLCARERAKRWRER